MALSPQREKFTQEYVLCGIAADAYRVAYPKSLKWQDNSVHVEASKLLSNTKVLLRVEELQAEAKKKYDVTVDSLAQEYADIIKEARDAGQFGPAISGTTKKGELFGLFEKHNKQNGMADFAKELSSLLQGMITPE